MLLQELAGINNIFVANASFCPPWPEYPIWQTDAQWIAGDLKRYGYLEKLSFCPNAALRVKILSAEYQLYACTKIFKRALILNQNPNFARYPYV